MPVSARTAERLDHVSPSVLHAVHRMVERVTGSEGRSVIRLHVGEPAFEPPECVPRAVERALRDGHTGYTAAEGLEVLRERIAGDRHRRSGLDAGASRVVVTPGSTQALLAIMLATCDHGDEVLVPATHWPIYTQAAAVAGLGLRFYSLGPGYRVDPQEVAAAATPRTRLLILNSPANPTGVLCDATAQKDLVATIHERGWWAISDEAYEDFVYEGAHRCTAVLENGLPEAERRIFSVHSFSKSYGMTGYRMGYAVAPSEGAAAALRRVQEGAVVAPSTPVQYGALAALGEPSFPDQARRHLEKTRSEGLSAVVSAGMAEALPPAGWYALLDISSSGLGSVAFAERLLRECDVAVAPGSAFVPGGTRDPLTIRLAFCVEGSTVVEGVRRLLEFCEGLERESSMAQRLESARGSR